MFGLKNITHDFDKPRSVRPDEEDVEPSVATTRTFCGKENWTLESSGREERGDETRREGQ